MKHKIFLLLSTFYFLFSSFGFALAAGEVVINEIAWMGTSVSANDEWIEIYNPTADEIDLARWVLQAQDGTPDIVLSGKVPAGGFFLLERTDDDSVPGISADQIYVGALANSGEVLALKDKTGQEIDRVDASGGWQAGDNTTKYTMQRMDERWSSGQPTAKTANVAPNDQLPITNDQSNPKDKNSNVGEESKQDDLAEEEILEVGLPKFASEPNQETSVNPEPKKVIPVVYPKSLYISEFLPDPKGGDSEGEWVELYNDADTAADVSGFFLDDGEEGSRQYQLPQKTSIPAKGFLLLSRSDTKIALNNNGDEVRLIYPDGSIAAKVSYADAREGYSAAYQKEKGTLFWTSNLTPGKANILSYEATKISKEVGNEQYQDARIGTLDDLPRLEVGELGLKSDSLGASIPASSGNVFDQFWIILLALIIGACSTLAYSRFVKKLFLSFLIGFFFFALPFIAFADSFFVAPDLHLRGRDQINAAKVWEGTRARVFLEDGAIASLDTIKKLGEEFDQRIYPQMVDLLGEPWTPGIDAEVPIAILFTRLINGIGGYFNGDDELPKSEKPNSNEKELIYLNADVIAHKKMPSFLAHEFQHLITFNQKIRPIGQDEEVWLNEVRSEYAPTFLGYDAPFPGSNLQDRYISFLESPHNNLIVWKNTRSDYGTVNMFGQYLNARFGEAFFREEMKTGKLGIASVSEALKRMDSSLTFPSFFAQWRLTNYINNDDIAGGTYSYKNSSINVKLGPELTFNLGDPVAKGVQTSLTVSSFDAKAIRLVLDDNRATVKVSSQQFGDDLVVAFLEEKNDGTFQDGQHFLRGGAQTLRFGKDIKAATILLSNASPVFSEATVTLDIQVQRVSEPAIEAIESAFLHPTPDQNVFLIKGKEFEEGLTLTFNDKPQPFTYQNDKMLITRVLPQEKVITVKVQNPDGARALFVWENPLAASLSQSAAVVASIPDGSLIRALWDSKVYIVSQAFKRHVIDSAIFSFYGHLQSSLIEDVNPQSLEALKTSNLIRFSDSPKVYEVLPDGKKRWIQTAEDFTARGFDWNAIFEVNEEELNFYTTQ